LDFIIDASVRPHPSEHAAGQPPQSFARHCAGAGMPFPDLVEKYCAWRWKQEKRFDCVD
jgi:hypothetical protein